MIRARRFGVTLLGALAVMLGLLLVAAGPASAHTQIVSSSPSNGERLDESPSKLVFVLSEPAEPSTVQVTVAGPGRSGRRAGDSDAERDGHQQPPDRHRPGDADARQGPLPRHLQVALGRRRPHVVVRARVRRAGRRRGGGRRHHSLDLVRRLRADAGPGNRPDRGGARLRSRAALAARRPPRAAGSRPVRRSSPAPRRSSADCCGTRATASSSRPPASSAPPGSRCSSARGPTRGRGSWPPDSCSPSRRWPSSATPRSRARS